MAEAENKTQPSAVSVDDFIAAVKSPNRRADASVVLEMMLRLSGHPPVMWGPSIVGFDRYQYRYDSGRTGQAPIIGFAPRAAALVLYVMDGFPDHDALLARLGPHTTGKCCLYIKKLADVDLAVLEELILASLAMMRSRYPTE